MSTKSNTVKKAAPVAAAADIVRAPIFTTAANPIAIPVEFRLTTAYVGNPERKAIEVNSPRSCKSLLNAADVLRRGVKYPFVMVGLHLHCDRAELSVLPYMQDVGYLGHLYKPMSENDQLATLVPEEGWVRLGVQFGRFTAYPLIVREAAADETQTARRDRMAFLLHGFMDAFLLGYSFHVHPVFYKGDDGGTDATKTLTERQAAFIEVYKNVFAMSNEEAAASYATVVANKQVSHAYGRLNAQREMDAAAGIAAVSVPEKDLVVDLVGGGTVTFADLEGKIIRRWCGKAEIFSNPTLTAEKWPAFVAVCKSRRLVVEIVGNRK